MKIIKKTINEDHTTTETLSVKVIPMQSKGEFYSKIEERVTTTVSKEQLEALYHIDGLLFRAINDYVDKIVGPGFYLEGKDNLVNICNIWLDNIKAKRLFEEIIKDVFIGGAGNGWLELGYNKNGNDIPSVRILNPKLMDYIRDKSQNNNIVLDENGDPLGFVQTKSIYRNETQWTQKEIKSNNQIIWSSKNNEDGRDRIAHFKLFGLGDAALGNSPVEAIYKQAIIRLNLEDNTGVSVHQSGGIVATVGSPDPNMPSRITPEIIDNISKDLQNVDMQSVFVFPTGTKLDRFPSPELKDRLGLLVYFASVQNIGLGIPSTRYALPGINIDQSSNINMDIDFEQRIIALQDRLAELIREKLLYRMLKARGLITQYADVPKFNFRIHTSSILRESIKMVAQLGRRDMVRRDPELEKYIRDELGLPTKYLDREIDQWEEDSTKIPSTPKAEKNVDTIQEKPNGKPEDEDEDKEENILPKKKKPDGNKNA